MLDSVLGVGSIPRWLRHSRYPCRGAYSLAGVGGQRGAGCGHLSTAAVVRTQGVVDLMGEAADQNGLRVVRVSSRSTVHAALCPAAGW